MASMQPAPSMAAPQSSLSASSQPGGSTTASNNSRDARIATHSHIKGLGLSDDGTAIHNSNGFVGQKSAREVSCLHNDE